MKTSNKLLLTATLVGFGYMALFDLQLKAEYNKGEYKKSTYNQAHIVLKPFTTIVNKAGNIIDLNIKQGPESGAWVDQYMKEEMTINQHNDTVYIDYAYNKPQGSSPITIICPTVNSLITKKHSFNDSDYRGGVAKISGFTQDIMSIAADGNTRIELNKNVLNKLNAGTTESNAFLTIHSDNQIKSADIKILGKSDLELFAAIANGAYSCTDSATVKLNGKSFRQLQQH